MADDKIYDVLHRYINLAHSIINRIGPDEVEALLSQRQTNPEAPCPRAAWIDALMQTTKRVPEELLAHFRAQAQFQEKESLEKSREAIAAHQQALELEKESFQRSHAMFLAEKETLKRERQDVHAKQWALKNNKRQHAEKKEQFEIEKRNFETDQMVFRAGKMHFEADRRRFEVYKGAFEVEKKGLLDKRLASIEEALRALEKRAPATPCSSTNTTSTSGEVATAMELVGREDGSNLSAASITHAETTTIPAKLESKSPELTAHTTTPAQADATKMDECHNDLSLQPHSTAAVAHNPRKRPRVKEEDQEGDATTTISSSTKLNTGEWQIRFEALCDRARTLNIVGDDVEFTVCKLLAVIPGLVNDDSILWDRLDQFAKAGPCGPFVCVAVLCTRGYDRSVISRQCCCEGGDKFFCMKVRKLGNTYRDGIEFLYVNVGV